MALDRSPEYFNCGFAVKRTSEAVLHFLKEDLQVPTN